MAEDETAVASTPTKEELASQLRTVLNTEPVDYEEVARLSAAIIKMEKEAEAAERAEREKEAVEMTDAVKQTIQAALAKRFKNGELDKFDGVWYSQDNSDGLVTCRLLKPAKKSGSTGGGGGKPKSNLPKTSELMPEYGDRPYNGKIEEFKGMTLRQAHDSTTDGNKRFKVREQLLKEAGYTS